MKDGTIPVGHIGFANCFNRELNFEIDNVIKGEKSSSRFIFRCDPNTYGLGKNNFLFE